MRPLLAETRRVVRVGFFPFEGYHIVSPDGRRSGYGYDYLQHLKLYGRWTFEYSSSEHAWPEMLPMLEVGKIDMVSSVHKTPEREALFAFSRKPIGQSATIMTVKSGNYRYKNQDYAHWNGIKVGFLRNSTRNTSFEKFANSKKFTYRPVYYDNNIDLINDLRRGDLIDAAVTSNLRDLSGEWIYEQFDQEPFYIVVRKTDTALLAEINRAMEQLDDQLPDLRAGLWRKYYKNDARGEISFTAEEYDFIQKSRESRKIYHAILNPDRAPLSFYAEFAFHGVLKQIADEIIRRSGLDIRFVPVKSRVQYRKACQNPEVDLVFDASMDFPLAESQNLVLCEPYFASSSAFLSLTQFTGEIRRVAMIKNSILSENIRRRLPPAIQLLFFDSNVEAVKAVLDGKCDGVYLYTRCAEAFLNSARGHRMKTTHASGYRTEYTVGIRDTAHPLLVSILNKASSSIGPDFIEKIDRGGDTKHPWLMPPNRITVVSPWHLTGAATVILLLFCGGVTGLLIVRKRQYRMGMTFQQLPLRYFVVTKDGRILFYALGAHSDTFPRKIRRLEDLPDAKVNRLMADSIREVLESRETKNVDFHFMDTRRTAMVSPLPRESFGCECAVWISQDTSELQRTRESAKLNEGYFRLTLNAIGDGVVATDAHGNVIMLNPVAERLIGIKSNDAVGRPHEDIFKIVGAYDNQPMQSPLRRTLRTGTIVELANHTDLQSLDGFRYHIADSSAPVFDEKKRIIGGILVFRDVSEEYVNRDRLQQALTSLEYAAQLSHAASFTYTPSTGVITGTGNLKNLWPLDGDDLAKPLEDWVLAEDLEEVLRNLELVKSNEIHCAACRYRAVFNGELRHYELRCSCDRSDPGNLRLTGVIQDISEITNNIEKLQNTQALWEEVVNHIPFMFAIKDAGNDFQFSFCNNAFAEFIGREKKEIINHNAIELNLAELETIAQKDRECLNGSPLHYILTLQNSAGMLRALQIDKKMFLGKDGHRLILLGITDVTELQNVIRNETVVKHVLEQVIQTNDFAQTLMHISTAIRKYFDCDRIILALCAPNEELKLHWEWHSEGQPDMNTMQIEKHQAVWSLHLSRLKNDEFIQYEDFLNQQRSLGFFDHGMPYLPKSIAGVPVFNDGKLWAVLMVSFSRNLHKFDQSEEKLMRALGSIIALAHVVVSQEKQIRQTHYENQLILNNIKIPISLFDKQRNIVYVNTVLTQLVNMSHEEIYKTPCYEVFRCGRETPENCIVCQSQQDLMSHSFLYEVEGRQYVTEAHPIIDDSGELLYTLECGIDVTEINKLNENDRILNFCLKTFFEETDVKTAIRKVLESIGRYMHASRCFVMHFDLEKRVADCDTEYVANNSAPIFICNARPIDPEEGWCQAFLNHQMLITEEFNYAKDQLLYGRWTKIIEDANTKSFYVGGIYVDGTLWGDIGVSYEDGAYQFSETEKNFITNAAHLIEVLISRQRSQTKILDAMRKAQAADRAKSYFLASMSHEIRTPLNAVIGFTELLQDEALEDTSRKEYLANIANSGNALLALINDILDLSKLEANQMDFHNTDLDFPAMLREVAQIFSVQCKKRGVAIHVEIAPDFPHVIRGDKSRLRQILFNLLGNAVKFTDQGHVAIKAYFEPVAPTTGTLLFQVEDTGIGIAPEDQKLLFQPFVQTKATRGTFAATQGTGLGLSIVHRMLKQMRGKIDLASTLGKGSVFTVTLYEVVYSAGQATGDAQKIAALPMTDTKFKHVLVVDDVAMNVKVLAAMLKSLGTNVFQATSGNSALELLKEHDEIDAVFTDLWMPEMNGVQLAKRIRSRKTGIFIAAVTADIECQQNFDTAQFDTVVNKPVSKAQILELLTDNNRMGR
ncbi:MAG: transporter substrate-binding domain-containing protein [Victivallaceae bacterium]|nr:transporter substrate-binding domain-containing protein [Victivallaceae bacterium]